ncbi:MAG: type I-F CRISPR-associated helicase Cas3f [Burkholderiaceae bacterium]
MNVLLISQCSKRALTETRRILDQFAERRGDRTWQTPITHQGLDTLRKLLRKTARRNTAVACHWIRGQDHSELLWLVGDASQFNEQGAVPTNTTQRNVLRQCDENDWHTGEDIHLLTALAALLHDLGKASQAFQMRLCGALQERNQYRHEWVSLRLFEAFVGDDDDATWLARLAAPTAEDDRTWLGRLQCDGLMPEVQLPFSHLARAPLAQAIGWLVLTHHRLPLAPDKDAEPCQRFLGGKVSWITAQATKDVLKLVDADWNEITNGGDASVLPLYWHFPYGLPVTTELWRKQAARHAQRLQKLLQSPGIGDWLANPYVMHVSRLCLMLADHHYSSLTVDEKGQPAAGRVKGQKDYPLLANTHGQNHQPNQALDEHLLGVAKHSAEVTHALPRFEINLPRLARHHALKKRTQDLRYHWQNKAADMAQAMRERSQQQGAFIVNMASTGCGKTLANARFMYALADPAHGMRCAFAMGLRTLTLQTGRSFRDLLSLGDDELAIRVGGSASRALFEHYEREAEKTGSASSQALLDEDSHVLFDGNFDAHPLLQRVAHDPAVKALLAAPILVCTIDHLTPATESQRGGRQIAPMLRLMSGDLVLDEPDDFDMDDLPALTRLVHWAGLLGARVLLSSATLPPALIQGLFEAYQNGRQHWQLNRGARPGPAGQAADICCAWVDEFDVLQADCAEAQAFAQSHHTFTQRRAKMLAEAEVRRRAKLVSLAALVNKRRDVLPTLFAKEAIGHAVNLHQKHHSFDPKGDKRVSFGLIRMANIEPLVEVAMELYRLPWPGGVQVHLCVYHSQFPLLIRSAIERRLDASLDRRQLDAVFSLPDIRQRLDAHAEPDQLFVVLGSPVTEVGRDHDYDWAVVEPSSARSLIQLAGRVRRHRTGDCSSPNIRVFDTNLRHFRHLGEPAFCKPGFETKQFPLQSHALSVLMDASEVAVMDARPRILAQGKLQPRSRLVDLEHARMQATMLPLPPEAVPSLNAASWWHLAPADALLTAVLPQQQPFRFDPIARVDLELRPNEEGDDYVLIQLKPKKGGRHGETVFVEIEKSQNKRVPDELVQGERITVWGQTNYMEALTALANELGLSLETCARRFGTVTLPVNANGWRFHPALGFTRAKS